MFSSKTPVLRFAWLFLSGILLIAGCSDDEPGVIIFTSDTYEANFDINPSTFPEGGGLDLSAGDTGVVTQLDTEMIDWDIQVKAIRTGAGGRPGVFLFGDTQSPNAVRAANVSDLSDIGTGPSGFNSFEQISQAMIDALAPDGIFSFDPETDVDNDGRPDAALLATAYENLMIGDRIVNLDEADQPVYLVSDCDGSYYKFQMIRRENGGAVFIRWARFTTDAISG